jgi:hypothetical protein
MSANSLDHDDVDAKLDAFLNKGIVPTFKKESTPAAPVPMSIKKEPSPPQNPRPDAATTKRSSSGLTQSSIASYTVKRKQPSGNGGGGGGGGGGTGKEEKKKKEKTNEKKSSKIKLTIDAESMEVDDDLYDENAEMTAVMNGTEYDAPLKKTKKQKTDKRGLGDNAAEEADMKSLKDAERLLKKGDVGPIDGDDRFTIPPDRIAVATIGEEQRHHVISLHKLVECRKQGRALRTEILKQQGIYDTLSKKVKEMVCALVDPELATLPADDVKLLQSSHDEAEREFQACEVALNQAKAKYELCARNAVEAREILMEVTESARKAVVEDIVEDGDDEAKDSDGDTEMERKEVISDLNVEHIFNQLRVLERREWIEEVKDKFRERLRTARVGIRGSVVKFQGGTNYRDLMYQYYYRSRKGNEYRVIAKWAHDDADLVIVPVYSDNIKDVPNSVDSWDEDYLSELSTLWPLQPLECIKDLKVANETSREAALLGFFLITMHTQTAFECAHALANEAK